MDQSDLDDLRNAARLLEHASLAARHEHEPGVIREAKPGVLARRIGERQRRVHAVREGFGLARQDHGRVIIGRADLLHPDGAGGAAAFHLVKNSPRGE